MNLLDELANLEKAKLMLTLHGISLIGWTAYWDVLIFQFLLSTHSILNSFQMSINVAQNAISTLDVYYFIKLKCKFHLL